MSDYSDDKSYIVQRIDAKTDEVKTVEGIKAYKMTVGMISLISCLMIIMQMK